ncbi:hypothetical protein G6F70_008617 [Rhizopus microsporus]|uniref:Uncharacterized protein n=1 Tax=Rhizopus microsporus TaxID=58291 RepID=A0A1X0S6H4_RHIZD|nr:hypothetical protein G6F71_001183 [Rhizopus microsporus]KAG1194946.1 hypothetical protein G6F70_008617 [Rhizopus microsporus]KAG1214659.1 hypothetical protein G6F69_001694 [Rhizopus microsporus]KAG1234251.1 hypothetical protein G6F67_003651 [Rhizopus microsporus]KAG1262718.1 hypothetical protein G6F68_005702 [Rhizopus microsporus]
MSNKKIPSKKTKITKHKKKSRGELDNPKFLSDKNAMLELIEQAARKEEERENQRLAKRLQVAKIMEEKEAQKEQKKEDKKEQLEQVKREYLESKKKKKAESRKQKIKTMREKENPVETKKAKKVRFAL